MFSKGVLGVTYGGIDGGDDWVLGIHGGIMVTHDSRIYSSSVSVRIKSALFCLKMMVVGL